MPTIDVKSAESQKLIEIKGNDPIEKLDLIVPSSRYDVDHGQLLVTVESIDDRTVSPDDLDPRWAWSVPMDRYYQYAGECIKGSRLNLASLHAPHPINSMVLSVRLWSPSNIQLDDLTNTVFLDLGLQEDHRFANLVASVEWNK